MTVYTIARVSVQAHRRSQGRSVGVRLGVGVHVDMGVGVGDAQSPMTHDV